jgi:hypothetical protein
MFAEDMYESYFLHTVFEVIATHHVKNALQNTFHIVQYGKAYINIDLCNIVGQNILSTYLFDLVV